MSASTDTRPTLSEVALAMEDVARMAGEVVRGLEAAMREMCEDTSASFNSLPAKWSIDRWRALPRYKRLYYWIVSAW